MADESTEQCPACGIATKYHAHAPEPTEQAGREALAEVMRGTISAWWEHRGWRDLTGDDIRELPDVLAAAVVADRDALQHRLTEAEATIERVLAVVDRADRESAGPLAPISTVVRIRDVMIALDVEE